MSTRARWQSQNTSPPSIAYSTAFSATENPISEGSRWTNGAAVGLDWGDARTTTGSPNKAYGTTISGPHFNDSIAILSGFPPNQRARATVFQQVGYTAPDSHEIELLLRFQITANNARGYEVDFINQGGSISIARWNGPLDNVTLLTSTGTGPGGLVTGDDVWADMIGSTINVYKNGSLIQTCTDTTYTDGNPGMGFFMRAGGTLENFCISQFSAAGL